MAWKIGVIAVILYKVHVQHTRKIVTVMHSQTMPRKQVKGFVREGP